MGHEEGGRGRRREVTGGERRLSPGAWAVGGRAGGFWLTPGSWPELPLAAAAARPRSLRFWFRRTCCSLGGREGGQTTLLWEGPFLLLLASPPPFSPPQTPARLFSKLDPTSIYKCQTNPRKPPPLARAPARRERGRGTGGGGRGVVWSALRAVRSRLGGLPSLGSRLRVLDA